MTRAQAVLLVVAASVLAVSFWFFRPAEERVPPSQAPHVEAPSPTGAAVSPPSAASAAVATAPTPTQQFDFVLQAGREPSGPEVMRVQQGDMVVLRVSSDAADALHLHGYDLEADIAPGKPTALVFTADRSGRFELELHRRHRTLGALEVLPR